MRMNKSAVEIIMADQVISMEKLSVLVGVKRSGLSRVINSKSNVRPVTAGRIARALNVPVEQIIEQEE